MSAFVHRITPHMLGMADAGGKVRFLGTGGYPLQLDAALEEFDVGEELTVRDIRIGDWESSYRFYGVDGRWNTVMFETIKPEQSNEPPARHPLG